MLAKLPDTAELDPGFPAFFRHREVAGKVVITNAEGSFLILTPDEFTAYVTGRIAADSELYRKLAEGNFIRAEFDADKAVERMLLRKRFLHFGPNLHLMVVTLRCNETCVYCHASPATMDAVDTDMSKETAEKAVDLVFQSTSPSVTIEFQGGEPLVNFPVVQHIIEYAVEKNKSVGKRLEFTMVSNLAMMTEEKLSYLIANRVQICTSIDGPRDLHDKQRKLPSASAFDSATRWIRRINQAYQEEMGLDPTLYHVEALLTTTREVLPRWKELIDTYVELGCRALFLRPVNPYGFAVKTRGKVGYSMDEYMHFYRQALDYIIDLNKQGVEILERYAAIFLTKILSGEDPNFLDIRNPCGAGIGVMAYNYDGHIFASDEGRMLHEMGDDRFCIGHVNDSRYRDLVGHETVREVVIASNRDAQPGCVNCAYNPYCGTDPVSTYRTQGSIFGRVADNYLCTLHKGVQDLVFEKLITGDREAVDVLTKWTTIRPRTHFVQDEPAAGEVAE